MKRRYPSRVSTTRRDVMKKRIALTAILVLALAVPALAQNNLFQVKPTTIFSSSMVSATELYATSSVIDVGTKGGHNIQGYFSLCWDAAGTGPDIAINYQACDDIDGTNCTFPYNGAGSDLSSLVSSTALWTANGGAGEYQCVPSGQMISEIGLFPYIRLIAKGIASNGADVTLDAWLIKH
jgi:hypothetical protein